MRALFVYGAIFTLGVAAGLGFIGWAVYSLGAELLRGAGR